MRTDFRSGIARCSRRRFIRTVGLASAGLAVSSRSGGQQAKLPAKQNLVVFLPDQLRTDTVFGPTANAVHAPNIHKLAAQSVVFDRAYVTHPICAPSRSSILSGTWPHQSGCNNNDGVLPRRFLCLPEMLGDSSYTSGYFGKWHLGDEFVPQHGFGEWTSILETYKQAERKSHAHRRLDQLISLFEPSKRPKRKQGASDYTGFLKSKGYSPDSHRGKAFSPEFATNLPFELSKPKFLENKACEFLERHGRRPFIMFVAFFEPHPPYSGPFNNEHSFDSIQLDATAGDVLSEETPLRSRLLQEAYRKKLGGMDGYRHTKQNYFGLINEIDRSIGTILAKIEDLGVGDRTITVLTSDHGDMMSAHGLLGKMLMYEQSAAVPYLVRAPGVSPRQIEQPVSHIDLLPTMLDLLGKQPHPQCAGKSRAAAIRGAALASDFVFLEWASSKNIGRTNTGQLDIAVEQSSLASDEEIKKCLSESTRAVVSPDGWKLCLRDNDKNELYNLHDDPEERQNLYYTGAHRDAVDLLTEQIHHWQRQTGDSLRI